MSGRPETIAVLVLAALAVFLAAQAFRQHRQRVRLVKQLRALSRPKGPGRAATDPILRRRDDPSARWVERVVRLTPTLRNLDQLLEQAGLPWKRSTVARMGLGLAIGLAVLALLLTGSPPVAGAALVLGLMLPRLYVTRRKAQRLRAFEEQFPDAIDLLGRAIRAGHGVSTGLRTVAEESSEPIASEFRRVAEEQRYGLPFEETMLALTRRIDLIDLRVMVVAILVQREVGGNLAEILDKISALIRTRFTLRRQLRVHTAQGRLSGYVFLLLPVGVAAALSVLDPEYFATLVHDPIGKLILGGALFLQTIGYLWIWRIIRMEI